jgi:hypothetical protein
MLLSPQTAEANFLRPSASVERAKRVGGYLSMMPYFAPLRIRLDNDFHRPPNSLNESLKGFFNLI